MSLFITTTEQVTGRGYHLFGGIGDRLLNTEGLFQLEDNDTTKSSFYYRVNLGNDQEGVARIESEDSAAVVAAYWNNTITSNFIDLDVYPDANSSGTTSVQAFNTAKIIIAYDFDAGSIIYLREGSKTVRYLVVQSIAEIMVLAMGEDNDTLLLTDGTTIFRLQVREGALFLDQATTATGFDGDEDTDWENIWEKALP